MNVMKWSVKWLIFIFLTAILMSCGNESQYREWGLKGKVKSVTEKYYAAEYDGERIEKGKGLPYGNYRLVFDEKGRLVEITYFDENGKVSGKSITVREGGKVREENFYNGEGKLETTTKVTHVSDNEIAFEAYDGEGVMVRNGTSFLEKGRVVKQLLRMYEDGAVSKEFTLLTDFDGDDNMVSQKQLDKDGDTYVTLYEYRQFDENGNWTEAITYLNGMPQGILSREISYY